MIITKKLKMKDRSPSKDSFFSCYILSENPHYENSHYENKSTTEIVFTDLYF